MAHFIDDITSSKRPALENSASAAKRIRTEPNGGRIDLYQALGDALYRAFHSVKTQQALGSKSGEWEIEVRMGMLHSDLRRRINAIDPLGGVIPYLPETVPRPEFASGIDSVLLNKVKEILVAEGFETKLIPLQRVRIDSNGVRFEVAPDGCLSAIEKKTKISSTDLCCLAYFYDLRVGLALEEPPSANSDFEPSGRDVERHKRRTTYTNASIAPHWRVDVTEVESFVKGKVGSTRELEMEFEVLPSAMKHLLDLEPGHALQFIHQLVVQLVRLIQLCVPSEKESSVHLHSPIQPSDYNRKEVLELIRRMQFDSGIDSASPSFLGSMPVNVTRKSFQTIMRSEYFVTEKSDGQRYLLFVVNSSPPGLGVVVRPVAVLMDRANQMVLLNGAFVVGAALRVGTVLDGELVHNLSFKKTVFLVFDVLALDNAFVYQRPFRERLELIRSDVMSRCKSYIERHWKDAEGPDTPTMLIRKDFVPKADIGSLVSKLNYENGNRIFVDKASGGRRHHRSDGFILQPAASAYVFGTDRDLMKWKWPELISVDLMVNLANGRLQLSAEGPDSIMIDCSGSAAIGKFDLMRLTADMEGLKKTRCVAEMMYDPTVGMWTYSHLRKDKNRANHIDTAISVFMEQAESVSVEELQYRLMARSEAEDDYLEQIRNMKARALEAQRQRTRGGR
jgi:hypothetical protein